jgi:hypothetical protein
MQSKRSCRMPSSVVAMGAPVPPGRVASTRDASAPYSRLPTMRWDARSHIARGEIRCGTSVLVSAVQVAKKEQPIRGNCKGKLSALPSESCKR